MFHVRLGQSLNLQFGAFTVLLFHTVVLLALIHSCRGQHRVIGPSQPIVALVGEDIILPSVLDPPVNAYGMTAEWTRPDLDPRFVLVWRDGVELESLKHPSYEGRVSVFTDELKRGNVSLKLSKVKISDGGRYRCFIPDFHAESTVQLVVGAVSSAVVQMTKNSSIVVLQCESKSWYPEPEVLWLDGEGNVLSAGPTETVRGPDDLYTVGSRLTVEKRHSNNFTCRVQQKDINQTREMQIHVSDHFFVVASTPGTPSTLGATSTPGTLSSLPVIIGSVFVCAALFLVFLVWKWRQKRTKNKRRGLEDGAGQTDKTITSKRDDTGFQVVMKEKEEGVPLIPREEGENNLDNRGQEEINAQSEHKDPKSVTERETNQDQVAIKPELIRDKDSTERGMEIKSVKNEKAPLTATGGETQDMIGRQVNNDLDKDEGQQMMKAVKENSGLPVVVAAGEQKEQLQNLHTDQEEGKEEETQREKVIDDRPSMNYECKKKAKTDKKRAKKVEGQEGATKEGLGLTGQKKQLKKDEIQLKSQNGDGDQHLFEDQEPKKNKGENKREKDQEGNQGNFTRTTERNAKNQNEQINEKLKETEKYQEEIKEQPAQFTMEVNVECQERREEKTDKGTGTNETQKTYVETEIQRQQQEVQQPDVKKEMRQQPEESLKVPTEEGAECLEVLQEKKTRAPRISEKSGRNQRAVEAIHQKGQEIGTIKEAGVDETQKTPKEIEKQGQLQAVQQLDIKEEMRQQPEETHKVPTEGGAEYREVLQEKKTRAPRISEKSGRNQRAVEAIHQKGQEIGTIKEAGVDETQKTPKEIEKQGQLQAVQQLDIKEEMRQQPEETHKVPTEGGAEYREVLQEKKTRAPRISEKSGGNHRRARAIHQEGQEKGTQKTPKEIEKQGQLQAVQQLQHKQNKEVHVDPQQRVRKRRRQEEDSEPTQETFQKRHREELNGDVIMHEPKELDENLQMDEGPICHEDKDIQTEEPMEN